MSKIALEGNASGTGTFTVAAPNSNSNYTLTLPQSTGTVVVTGGAQTIEFAAGTASTPSITFTGDTNTGIFSPAADTIAFTEGGAESMRINSSGNLGLGVTPSAWGGAYKVIQFGIDGVLNATTSTGNGVILSKNFFNDGSANKYINTDYASFYQQVTGQHQWFTAASGTAGNTISFTQAMTLDASGFLGIGNTTPRGRLSVGADLNNGATDASTGINLKQTSTTAATGIYIERSGERKGYYIYLGAGNDGLGFQRNNAGTKSDVMVLDRDGNVLVGTTSAKSKFVVNDGQISVGSVGSGGNGIYLYINDTLSDNSYMSRASAGNGTTTWYIGNQTITTSSDSRLKANIKPTERNAIELLNQWEIVDHTWNDPSDQCENNRNSRGVWTGVVAQQVQPITPWLVNKPTEEVNEDGTINPWTMDFGYAVPLLVKAIQELKAINDAQAARIETLETKVAVLENK